MFSIFKSFINGCKEARQESKELPQWKKDALERQKIYDELIPDWIKQEKANLTNEERSALLEELLKEARSK